MLHILTYRTVLSREALSLGGVPRGLLWRGLAIAPPIRPLQRSFWRLFGRIFFEQSLPRYLIALVPFPIAMAIWPELALPIAQAPLAMFALIYVVETNVLSVSTPEKRRAVLDEVEAARRIDRLRVRGADILTRIAAGRDLREGALHLAVEQSPLARIAPLTLVSVQVALPAPHVLDLDDAECALIAQRLFGGELREEDLHLANLRENTFLRSVELEARAISAHARLAARAERRAAS